MQHIGFIVVSNSRHKDFRYPLMRHDHGHAVKTPDRDTVPILLTTAKKQGAKLQMNSDLDAETRMKVQKIWGK